jgi:hypothetical protein
MAGKIQGPVDCAFELRTSTLRLAAFVSSEGRWDSHCVLLVLILEQGRERRDDDATGCIFVKERGACVEERSGGRGDTHTPPLCRRGGLLQLQN